MTRITKTMVKEVLEGVCGQTSNDFVDDVYEKIESSIKLRGKEISTPIDTTIFGAHDLKGSTVFIFSTDPWDIFRMSAGPISKMSCMSPVGVHNRGIYDDIAKQSVIAIIKEYGGPASAVPNWHARVMLRWCKAKGKRKPKLGIEGRYYSPYAGRSVDIKSNIEIAPSITAAEATSVLKRVLSEHGLIDYKVCITKDEYAGYSDVAGASQTRIAYKRP